MKGELPRNIIFFDTETTELPEDDETELVLILGQACYWRREYIRHKEVATWQLFKTKDQFWDFVFSHLAEKQKIYLVAHNVSFDFRVVKGFDTLKEEGFKIEKLIFNGTTNIWSFKKGTKTICVLDNMNFFKSSLKTLGESVGLVKLELPDVKDHRLMEIYCKRDVQIMIEAWKLFFKFLKDNDLGNFSKTIAGQAFTSYRHRFMKEQIHIHTNTRAIQLERLSYHGGRTECFYIGTLPSTRQYYLLDVNSMYPSVMKEFEYPSKLVALTGERSIKETKKLLKKYCLTARVIVETKQPVFPLTLNNKLVFPIGKFETILTTREIKYAIDHNILLENREAAVYEKANLFNEYVDFFYNKRKEYKKEGKEAFNFMCKLFLNSLYGKFGQRNDVYEDFKPTGAIRKWLDTLPDGVYREVLLNGKNTYRKINGKIEISRGMVEGINSFVAIAAHITADARMKLWYYFKEAGRENIFYCDTDSIMVNAQGYLRSKKMIDTSLGMLSLKDSTNHLSIYGAKDYEFGKDVVIKGIKKDAKKIGRNSYSQIKFEGLSGALRKGRLNKMYISTTHKTLKRLYDKGKVLKSGRVLPLHVNSLNL